MERHRAPKRHSLDWEEPIDRKRRPPLQLPPPRPRRDIASEFILECWENERQTQEELDKKLALKNALSFVITGAYPDSVLHIIGSSMNGFGSRSSDMDMCLLLSQHEEIHKKEAIRILNQIMVGFRKCSFLRQIQVIHASVPILKFRDSISGIECDLNINGYTAVRNTHLLNAYSKYEPRVQPLVMFIKRWAKFHNIGDASRGTLSSYSLTLMVLHYLQYACQPPVIPSLQEYHPDLFSDDTDLFRLQMDCSLRGRRSSNQMSLGELLQGFFNYYSFKFSYDRHVISVRLAKTFPREQVQSGTNKQKEKQWKKSVCIEEPFELKNTNRTVAKGHTMTHILRVFRASHAKMVQTGDASSLFHHPF